ncbi:uncharacterized protein LJ264_016464 [Porphyrio hochstetteri]
MLQTGFFCQGAVREGRGGEACARAAPQWAPSPLPCSRRCPPAPARLARTAASVINPTWLQGTRLMAPPFFCLRIQLGPGVFRRFPSGRHGRAPDREAAALRGSAGARRRCRRQMSARAGGSALHRPGRRVLRWSGRDAAATGPAVGGRMQEAASAHAELGRVSPLAPAAASSFPAALAPGPSSRAGVRVGSTPQPPVSAWQVPHQK